MAATFNQFADDEIVFVSVGQGDCTHIRAKGSTSGFFSLFMSGSGGRSDADDSCNILIDGGGTAERDIGKDTLMPYLLANGAGRVELALTTHLHSDHFLGLLQLNKVYPVGAVGVPDDYRRSIEKMKSRSSYEDRNSAITGKTQYSSEDNDSTITNTSTNTNKDRASNDDDSSIESINDLLLQCGNLRYVSPGSRIRITEDVFIDVIWPLKGHPADNDIDDPNEKNDVYIINYRGVRIMVTGDLLEEDEKEILDHYSPADLHCDILKVAHHGSKSSSSEEFLDAVDPSIAVIQAGRNNIYGHPHDQTLMRLEERDINVYRTDLNGAVGIDLRRGHIKVDTVRTTRAGNEMIPRL